jgi:tetratricopeptide (TPR) repeat protein
VLRNEHASEDRDNGAPRDLAALAEERRRALARRFAGSGTQRRATPGTGQPAQAQTGPGVAPNSVRHAAGPSGVGHYLTLIEEALKENNSVSASNTLRVAQSIENLSDAAKRELAAVEPRVQRALSEHLNKQASAEEREGNPDRAAALWARAATANPTLENLERAAVALLRVRSDLRQAADFTKQAMAKSPDSARLHLMLGQIYALAGMQKSALSELERAARLDPTNATIKEWLKRTKRGEV